MPNAEVHTPPRGPLVTPGRVVGALALAAVLTFAWFALRRTVPSTVAPVSDPAVVKQIPKPGSNVPRQTQVGAILQPGYDGRITVNQVPIPENQMDGAIPPGAPGYDPALGPRPNTKNEVLFTPGKGKAIASFDTGQVSITVRFWKIADGPRAAKTITWSVAVT